MGKIDTELKWNELSSIIISYFIIDVTENTLLFFKKNKNLEILKYGKQNRKCITKEIVNFSESGSTFNNKIKTFIDNKIINSFNVNRFDGKSKYILRQLFKAYYENPRQMPKNQLIILAKRIQSVLKDIPELKEEFKNPNINFQKLYEINENYVDINSLNDLLDYLKLNLYDNLKLIDSDVSKCEEETVEELNNEKITFEEITQIGAKIFETCGIDVDKFDSSHDFDTILKILTEHFILFTNKHTIEEIRSIDDKEVNEFFISVKGSSELHYTYLSTICDYISQMTDDYAIKEYEELYLS